MVGQLALPNMGISGVSSTTNRIGPGHATRELGTSLSYTSVTFLLSRKTVNIGRKIKLGAIPCIYELILVAHPLAQGRFQCLPLSQSNWKRVFRMNL